MRSVSRHKSIDVLSSYVRDADAFTDHAGAGLYTPTPPGIPQHGPWVGLAV
jgi:hypothetical protein